MKDEMMKEIDLALDECIKKLRNATRGKEIRTFITEYEELMFKKSGVVSNVSDSNKEPVEIKRQKDSWQEMRELGIEIKNENVVFDVVNLLLNSKLSYLDANEALREADRALRHKAFTAT